MSCAGRLVLWPVPLLPVRRARASRVALVEDPGPPPRVELRKGRREAVRRAVPAAAPRVDPGRNRQDPRVDPVPQVDRDPPNARVPAAPAAVRRVQIAPVPEERQAVGLAAVATTVPPGGQRPKTDGQKVHRSKRPALGAVWHVVEQERPRVVVSSAHHAPGAMQSKQRHLSADPTQCDGLPLVRFPTKQPMRNDVQPTMRVPRKMMR